MYHFHNNSCYRKMSWKTFQCWYLFNSSIMGLLVRLLVFVCRGVPSSYYLLSNNTCMWRHKTHVRVCFEHIHFCSPDQAYDGLQFVGSTWKICTHGRASSCVWSVTESFQSTLCASPLWVMNMRGTERACTGPARRMHVCPLQRCAQTWDVLLGTQEHTHLPMRACARTPAAGETGPTVTNCGMLSVMCMNDECRKVSRGKSLLWQVNLQ